MHYPSKAILETSPTNHHVSCNMRYLWCTSIHIKLEIWDWKLYDLCYICMKWDKKYIIYQLYSIRYIRLMVWYIEDSVYFAFQINYDIWEKLCQMSMIYRTITSFFSMAKLPPIYCIHMINEIYNMENLLRW